MCNNNIIIYVNVQSSIYVIVDICGRAVAYINNDYVNILKLFRTIIISPTEESRTSVA